VRREPDTNSKFTPHLLTTKRRYTQEGAGFTCEACFKKVGVVIKEYGRGRWLCYDCHYRREVSKGTRETLIKGDNKNV
jgi:hypothetical protein